MVGQVVAVGAASRGATVGGALLKVLAFLGVFLLGVAAMIALGVYLSVADTGHELAAARETAELRTQDMLKRTGNLRLELLELRASLVAEGDARFGVGTVNDRLADYWVAVAAYGIGADPYPDRIRAPGGGAWPVKRTPDYGIAGTSAYGVPRLYDRVLALEDVPDAYRREKAAELEELVAPFANPGLYPPAFREFHDRTRGRDRDVEESRAYMRSPAFATELALVDAWLESVEARLGRLPPLLALADRPPQPREWWRFWQSGDAGRASTPPAAVGTRA